jgi:hypothetical protein
VPRITRAVYSIVIVERRITIITVPVSASNAYAAISILFVFFFMLGLHCVGSVAPGDLVDRDAEQ